MNQVIFYLPPDEQLARKVAQKLKFALGQAVFRRFPDKETFVQIKTEVKNKNIILFGGLNDPDEKFMPIVFFAETARKLGAKSIGLVAPYLGYLRQDKEFHPGEAINSRIFASMLSPYIDWLVTIDPHLHRHHALNEIYTVPAHVLHAESLIAKWIKDNINQPVLIGPDEESKQWVSGVAQLASAPYIVLDKMRHGDREVEISVPKVNEYKSYTPVLVDDIISTARTMIETVRHLDNAGMNSTVCIGVHAIFVNNSYQELLQEKVAQVITCNTIQHESNVIDVSELIVEYLQHESD
ncbi:MAG: ribose-phosphate pyrophosphokinase [Gammaproteobacteria bacterium]|jgi:ribose-phosphate pyrophosphokinase